jgi:hypothetical protein
MLSIFIMGEKSLTTIALASKQLSILQVFYEKVTTFYNNHLHIISGVGQSHVNFRRDCVLLGLSRNSETATQLPKIDAELYWKKFISPKRRMTYVFCYF